MSRIRINYVDLEKQSSVLRRNIQTYESLINRSKSIITEVGSSWSGKASEAFVGLNTEYITNANKMVGLLQQFIKITLDVSNRFKNVDSSCAKSIKNSY